MDNRSYYDAFAQRYDDHRQDQRARGYHQLIDELEIGFVERFARGAEVLEVGCGTGLLLQRMQGFASRAVGVDLSPKMLDKARERGLDVCEGDATLLPFPDASFDVACSFKVLAHVADIELALAEMARVLRPDGKMIVEFYNPWSLRALAKRLGPSGAVAEQIDEGQVYTRYDSPRAVERLIPPGFELVASRGVRIITPSARLMQVPGLGRLLWSAEMKLSDTALARFGGFWIAALQRTQAVVMCPLPSEPPRNAQPAFG